MSNIESPRRTRLRAKPSADTKTVVTPSKCTVMANANTPRRSARKSVKPIFDYLEIINVVSPSKKRDADVNEEKEREHWNPAVVGKTSEKRGRKRTHGNKLAHNIKSDSSTDEENDMANISLSVFSPNKEEKVPKMTKTVVLEEKKEIENSNKVSEIDCLELGLAPLAEEPETEIEFEKVADEPQQLEEMESLIICDEDDMSPATEEDPKPLDATFDTSDCIIVSPSSAKPENGNNLLTVPQIIITIPNSLSIESEKPQSTAKIPRIQTPYKPKLQNVEQEDMEAISNTDELALNVSVERVMRKRSVSISIDVRALPAAQKSGNRVTFYSPANQTNYIEDFEDEELEEDNMKENIEKVEEPSCKKNH